MKMTSLGDLHPWVGLTSPSRVSPGLEGLMILKHLNIMGDKFKNKIFNHSMN